MVKIIKQFLRNKGYTIHTDSTNELLMAYHISKHFVVSYTDKGKTMICHRDTNDIRFNGTIKNVQQMKFVLELIND